MEELMEYLRERSPDDVVKTLEWLTAAGFVVFDHGGPAGESFGNILIEFRKDDLRVLVVRDRGQWAFDMAPSSEASFVPAHVLQTAAWPESHPADYAGPTAGTGTTLPAQLPIDTVWAIVVPLLVDWLTESDRCGDIRDSHCLWNAAADAHWGRP